MDKIIKIKLKICQEIGCKHMCVYGAITSTGYFTSAVHCSNIKKTTFSTSHMSYNRPMQCWIIRSLAERTVIPSCLLGLIVENGNSFGWAPSLRMIA